MKNSARIFNAIRNNPGMTEHELSKTVFGPGGYPQQVNGQCRTLLARDVVRRFGPGGKRYPYRYYAVDAADEFVRGKESRYGEILHESFLIQRKSMLEMKISIFENKLGKAQKALRDRDIDGFSQIQFPSETEIGVALSLLRVTNTQLSLLVEHED